MVGLFIMFIILFSTLIGSLIDCSFIAHAQEADVASNFWAYDISAKRATERGEIIGIFMNECHYVDKPYQFYKLLNGTLSNQIDLILVTGQENDIIVPENSQQAADIWLDHKHAIGNPPNQEALVINLAGVMVGMFIGLVAAR